jgi:hypothetical protein
MVMAKSATNCTSNLPILQKILFGIRTMEEEQQFFMLRLRLIANKPF